MVQFSRSSPLRSVPTTMCPDPWCTNACMCARGHAPPTPGPAPRTTPYAKHSWCCTNAFFLWLLWARECAFVCLVLAACLLFPRPHAAERQHRDRERDRLLREQMEIKWGRKSAFLQKLPF